MIFIVFMNAIIINIIYGYFVFFVIYKYFNNYEIKICAFKNFLFKW